MKTALLFCILMLLSVSLPHDAQAKRTKAGKFSYLRIDWDVARTQPISVQYSDDKNFEYKPMKIFKGNIIPFTIIVRDKNGYLIASHTFYSMVWTSGPGANAAIISKEFFINTESDWYKNTPDSEKEKSYKKWDADIAKQFCEYSSIGWKFKGYVQYARLPLENDLGSFSRAATGEPQVFCTRSKSLGKLDLFVTKQVR